MEIRTKFGPAAILMDTSGNKMGIVKRINVVVQEGQVDKPHVEYVVRGCGVDNIIHEKDAIQLITSEYLKEKEKEKAKETPTVTVVSMPPPMPAVDVA